MEDFPLSARVVVRTSNLKISRSHMADYVKNCTKERVARAARLVVIIQPIMFQIYDTVVAVAVAVGVS